PRMVRLRRVAAMDVPNRIGQPLLAVLPRVAGEKLLIFVAGARDAVKVKPLRGLRLAIHKQRKTFRAGIAQPLVDGQAVTFRLGDFLALLVEKELVVESFRRQAAKRAADFARELDRV